MDANSLDGTIFTGRVAHGYFILSRAAGLFVDPPKGPVLLNYGIEEARFTKPVYPGATIQVKFTVKEKVDQEKKPKTADSPKGADIATGIVKFLVDVVDETGETVAIATILTMVRKLDQNEPGTSLWAFRCNRSRECPQSPSTDSHLPQIQVVFL
ncbi:MAG: hypothetical protein LKM36_13655 [Flavobacteriales bacterium]|jgi:oxepin-CoA hydrolase/3-oxo-5,6-dehydrosuberyl-CoA semialdehyde dehydrogenase|nr:hypothetical protein [Flavobacteriales bacterium]